MKKIIIALAAFSLVFTACSAIVPSNDENELKVSIESVDIVDKEDNQMNEVSVESKLDIESTNEELLGTFDVLLHHDYDFSNLTYKSAEIEKNIIIEAIVKDTFFKERENPDYSYTYNYTNLNDDEFDDMIVLLGGMEFAGSGGSTVLILRGEEGDGYSLINKVTLARTPIVVTDTYSNGYKDLMFVVYGGGSETLHNILRYDGEKYPLNPSVQLEAESGRVFRGEALIANTEYYKNLIKAGKIEE